jgi:hypothetical protein
MNGPTEPSEEPKPPSPGAPTFRGVWFVALLGAIIVITVGFLIYFSQWKGKISIPTPAESVKDK